MKSRCWLFLAVTVALAAIGWSCAASPDEQKVRLLELGRIRFEAGDHRLASILYRKALQLDRRYGEAYYRLALNHIAQQEWRPAAAALWRAYECGNAGEESFRLLADIYLRIYTAGERRDPRLLNELVYLLGLERSRHPDSLDIPMVEGVIALFEGQYSEAAARLKEVVTGRPNDVAAILYLCRALDADGRAAEARKLARTSLKDAPANLALYDFLYSQSIRANRWEEAGALRREAVEANPESLDGRIALAAHYHRTGKSAEMNRILTQILAEEDLFPEGRLTAAEFYMRVGRPDAATSVYEEGLRRADSPRERQYRLGLAIAVLAAGDRTRARTILDSLLEKEHADVPALTLRASIHLGSGDQQEMGPAIRDLMAALRLKPGDPFLRFALGDAYLRQGDAFAARSQFSEALEREPGFLLPKLALASLAMTNHEYERAHVLAEEALVEHPKHLGARLLLADAWIGLREFDEARTVLNTLLAEYPGHLDGLHAMARLQSLDRRFDEAIRTYQKILRLAPDDPRAMEGTIGVLVAAGRLPRARDLLHEELKRYPGNAAARMALATIESRMGLADSALVNYRLVAARYPARVEVYTRMAEACIQLSRLDEAREHLDRAIRLDQTASEAKVLLGVLEIAAGARQPAIRLFEEALEHQPDSVVALNNLAFLLQEENRDLDRALTLAQRARSLAPKDDGVADTLAWILLKRNLAQEAEPLFRGLVERSPGRARYRCGLAQALAEAGDSREALIHLRAARELEPNPAETAVIESLAARLDADG